MTRVDPTDPMLVAVAAAARRYKAAVNTARSEVDAFIAERTAAEQEPLEQAVMDALHAGLTVTAVARAFTGPGLTPNRNRIYEIKAKLEPPDEPASAPEAEQARPEVMVDYAWAPRTVTGPAGDRTVYDLTMGAFRWKVYDDRLEPADEWTVSRWSPEFDIERAAWIAENPKPE